MHSEDDMMPFNEVRETREGEGEVELLDFDDDDIEGWLQYRHTLQGRPDLD